MNFRGNGVDEVGQGKVALVLAAGQVNDELLGDLGPIRTSRIPLGGASILARQLLWLRENYDDVAVTVDPVEMTYARVQVENLSLTNVQLVEVPSSLSLAESLLEGIRAVDYQGRPLHVYFGDTLASMPESEDAIVVAPSPDPDRWALIERSHGGHLRIDFTGEARSGELAVVGVFAFSAGQAFARLLEERIAAEASEAFWNALKAYDDEYPLALENSAYWFDVGHIDTYFKTRQQTLGGRAFNALRGANLRVRKESAHAPKIVDEINWYTELSPSASEVVPALRAIGESDGLAWYEMEYVPAVSLGESLVFGSLDLGFWCPAGQAILSAHRLLRSGPSVGDSTPPATVPSHERRQICRDLVATKTEQRVTDIRNSGLPATLLGESPRINGCARPSLATVLGELDDLSTEIASKSPWGVTHGDFFLGNMLFDRRLGGVKLIDPRGTFGSAGNRGPQIYDVAKLSQSVNGRYDYLSANIFQLRFDESSIGLEVPSLPSARRALEELSRTLIDLQAELGVAPSLVRRLEAVLLISAASLHYESPWRQAGLISSGLIAWDEADDLA